MLPGYLRLFVFLVLVAISSALGQGAAPTCDLAHVPQPKSHLTFVDANNAEVSALLAKGYADPPKGIEFFDQALTLARTDHDGCGEALAEYGIAAAIEPAKLDEIQLHLKNAVDQFSALGATHALAQAHYMFGQAQRRAGKAKDGAASVMQASHEFEASGDREHAVHSKFAAILIDKTTASPQAFDELLKEAHAIHAFGTEGAILHHIGDADFVGGHFATALEHYQQARQILEDCRCNSGELATLLVSMGRMERAQGQPEQALKNYAIALELQQSIGEFEYSIQTRNAMAVAYEAMGRYQEALEQYQHALEQANAVGAKQFVPLLEGNIGGTYLKLKQYQKAVRQLQMVIAKGASNYQLCFRYTQLGEALLGLGRWEESYAAETTAVETCRKGEDRESLADALEGRVDVAMAQKHYEGALADAREALAIREDVRSHLVPDDARKQGYSERIQTLYDISIELLTQMGRQREALEVAEQGRARAFLDLMGTQALPADGQAEHRAIDAPSFASYETAASYTANEMVDAAKHYDSTILAYWIGEKALYTWVVRQDGGVFEVRTTVSHKRLAKLVGETTGGEGNGKNRGAHVAGLQTRGGETLSADMKKPAAWHTLYDLLITPIHRYLPQRQGKLLTIIPHHELFRLSFAALTDGRGEYLVEHYALHTVSASALLRYTQANAEKAAASPEHYLLIANPTGVALEGGLSLPALPSTMTEVQGIARLLPAVEVTSLAGVKAQQGAVTDALQSATVVHFATHAVMDDLDPRRSFLLFYPPSESKVPVRMTTADIYRLKLHTNLVVLSACRTGLGRITGDGIDGFSRAFFYAGTASFLATLWDVADEPTAVLLPRFYRELHAGKSRSEALRKAQIGMIQKLRTGKVLAKTALGPMTLPENPVFWAAFSLSGEP